MKHHITSALKQLTQHKRLLWLLIVTVLFALAVVIYISMTIEPSELKVITHYTAYGNTHFYRAQWFYLVSFVVFIIMTAVLGIGVAVKLLRQDREALALMYGWVSIGLIAMTLMTYIHLTRFI